VRRYGNPDLFAASIFFLSPRYKFKACNPKTPKIVSEITPNIFAYSPTPATLHSSKNLDVL
jgi:hypothetical protein